jgi:hypothetical protein
MKIKGVFQPLGLAAVLAAGFVVVWGLFGLWAVGVGAYVAGGAEADERLLFLPDGTPWVARAAGRRGECHYRDLDGKAVPPPENDHAGWLAGAPLPAALPGRVAAGAPSSARLRSFADGRAPATFWYFVSDGRPDGTGYFVGYDSHSRACVGYLGTAGFRQEMPGPAELFPFGGKAAGPGARVFCTQRDHNPTEHPSERVGGRAPRGSVSTWDVYVLGRDGKLYHADLHARTVQVALDEPRLRSAALFVGVHDPVRGTPHRLAARTDDAVLVLDERGGLLRRYPIPEALRGRDLSFAETTAGEALLYASSPLDGLATEVDYHLCWVAPGGRCREARVALAWSGSLRAMQTLGGAVVPCPVVLGGLVGVKRTSALLDEGLAATYPEALGRAVAEFRGALALALLAAAGLAVLCYRRQVRYGAGGAERVVWPLFVLAFGLPGWVGYRFGRSWPVLETCPACNVAVPRDRAGCARCEAEFPRPALRGTEVFA